MQDYNKKNLYFLLCVFAGLLVVFFTVVMLTYVGKRGLWSVILPLVAEGYGVYAFVKKIWQYKPDKEDK